ncbi:MAG: N-acetylmuramate/N-acetylglucosamine kinase [Rhodocyclaceae bacterium]|nr:MAG: phosphotransferase [Rhodocyclaceae bacterium]MBV6408822.1 N-acetylmuramate/N-acetylglucosamine kinase [Rhodocyclaceae bacterium]CAG0945810.1 N-acetylmuramate 1-kinase [Gammaproteobacteria bacterium]
MQRLELVHDWLAGLFPGRPHSVAPASADASFRRYFRVGFDDGTTRIVMDAPPEHEDCRPFVRVAGLLRGAGVHAPEILAEDLARGLLLLTDLGSTTYLDALDASNADALFRDAIDALVKWQLASRPDALPPYDEALLRRELSLFPDWYVARHLGAPLTAAQQEALEGVQCLLLQNILAQPQVFVHRDYMPRNLMVSAPNPGVLDFQDAVSGPVTYDVASLFRDAFVGWEEERVLDWTVRYWEKARRAGLPVDADFARFYRDMEWMGLQRHLKVLGIFARINYRDGKPKYLADTPRFVSYVRHAATRYAPLAPLARLFDELEERRPQVGYTF